MSETTIKQDDYAFLHYSYHEDTDLAMIADMLDDEHGMGWLVFLYWPRMIAKAKQAKTFGWFSITPRSLATSVHDNLNANGSWAARARMWEMLIDADLIRVRQGAVENPSMKLDVLLVEYEKWQKITNKEKQKLKRERTKLAAGEPVHWTVRHWSEFAFTAISSDTPSDADDTESEARDTENGSRDTESEARDTTLDETRRNERKEGARDRALPTSVLETIEQVRSIPGMSRFQLESNVRKALAQYPSLDEAAICEAITAFEANVPEGATLKSGQSWTKLRNCFEVARRRMDEAARSGPTSPRGGRLTPGTAEWRQAVAASLGSPEGSAA